MWQIKEMIALAMLAICAYTDIKERYIYVFPLAVCATGSSAISIAMYFSERDPKILAANILLPILFGICAVTISKLGPAVFSEGDGILMASFAIVTSVERAFFSLVAGSAAAAVYSVFMLFIKRRKRTLIPFAPFVMAGFLAVLIYEIQI